MNNQPWFFSGGMESSTLAVTSPIVDRMNKISAGIALCHLWLAAVHSGRTVEHLGATALAKPLLPRSTPTWHRWSSASALKAAIRSSACSKTDDAKKKKLKKLRN